MLVFGIYNNISNHFYFHFLESLNWQQSIYFSTIHYKTCGNKIDEEGLHLLLYLILQNNPPLCWLLDQTKYLLILRALDMWTSSELYFFRTFARKKRLIYSFSLMCWIWNEVCLWYVHFKPLKIFHLPSFQPWPHKYWIFLHHFLLGVSDFCLHIRVIIRHHTHNNYPPSCNFFVDIKDALTSISEFTHSHIIS